MANSFTFLIHLLILQPNTRSVLVARTITCRIADCCRVKGGCGRNIRDGSLKCNNDSLSSLNIYKSYLCSWELSYDNYVKKDARDVAMTG